MISWIRSAAMLVLCIIGSLVVCVLLVKDWVLTPFRKSDHNKS